MKRGSKKKIVAWALFLCWISLIFYMSNQPAKISYKESRSVIHIIKYFIIDIKNIFSGLTNHDIRKVVQVVKCFILIFLVYYLLKCYIDRKNNRKKYLGGTGMRKYSKKKILVWLLFLCWISLIFYMSNQPATISDEQSGFVIDLITSIGIDIESRFGELTNFVVRKAAHVSEYCILAFIAYNLVRCYTEKKNHARIYCIIIVFLYACTDEIHQLFVPGRSGMFRDVLIDTSGAVIAAVVLYIIDRVKRNKHKAIK